jgi:hypothetical protein
MKEEHDVLVTNDSLISSVLLYTVTYRENVFSLERFCFVRFWMYLHNEQNAFWDEIKRRSTT